MQAGTPGSFRPRVSHVVSQIPKKGEDVTIVHLAPYQDGSRSLGYSLAVFAVADGHNGSAAAEHCQELLYAQLTQHLPSKPPPSAGNTAVKAYAEKLREAVTMTFLTLEGQFVLTGQLSGCTLTLVVITDWLLTVAAVGDSKAVLDLGGQFLEVTPEHRVQHHLAEQERLRRAGTYLAPISVYMDGAAEADEPGYGPLRAWPGGLCVSRAIGDIDVGECIIAHPHIMQLQIPDEGARVIVASDGLWDCFPSRKVVKMARTKETHQAGEHIQRAAMRKQGGQISDDLTVVVVDMLPPNTTFPEVATRLTQSNSNGSTQGPGPTRVKPVKKSSSIKSLFGCGSDPIVLEEFEPSFHDPSVRDPSTRGRGDYSNHPDVNIIADVDSHIEFAHLSPMSVTHKQQLGVQQANGMVPPFQQQPNLEQGSGSSDSASSRMVIDDSTHAQGRASQRQSLDSFAGRTSQRQSVDRTKDQTTHAGGQARPLLQKKRSKTNVLSRNSLEHDLAPPYSTKQSSVINLPPLGRRSIGERVKALSRNSLDSRTGSGELDRVSATHYGGQTPTMVPVRSSSLGPPEQMIVDPTTHAEAGFRKRRSANLDGVISNV